MRSKNTAAKRAFAVLGVIVAILLVAGFWYVNDYYRADADALAAMSSSQEDGVEIRELDGGSVAFVPDHPIAGLVFYPGAKVQPEAYAPLMRRCAQQGLACAIVRPPLNLALLDMGSAGRVMAQFPDMDTWVVAGHSMGGVAAANFVSHNQSDVDAVVFLASYPSVDLSSYQGQVISAVGTNDGVINRGNFEEAFSKLPAAHMISIEGGNHAYFGNYGEQRGDGQALITREAQQEQAAAAITDAAKAA